MTITLTEEQKIKLLNSKNVFSVMQEILLRENEVDQEKEHFWMIGLSVRNHIQYIELISLGSIKATTVEPMNVFRIAVLKGSAKVILVHNHPSGELTPSKADEDVTDRLIQVGIILDVEVIDHLIISPKSYLSFTDIGLMDTLRESTKWVPQYQLIKQIKAEEAKIREQTVKKAERKAKTAGKREGEKIKAIKVAQKSLKEGLAISLIAKLTGLTKKEIEGLQ